MNKHTNSTNFCFNDKYVIVNIGNIYQLLRNQIFVQVRVSLTRRSDQPKPLKGFKLC